jgi:hypothetical protein
VCTSAHVRFGEVYGPSVARGRWPPGAPRWPVMGEEATAAHAPRRAWQSGDPVPPSRHLCGRTLPVEDLGRAPPVVATSPIDREQASVRRLVGRRSMSRSMVFAVTRRSPPRVPARRMMYTEHPDLSGHERVSPRAAHRAARLNWRADTRGSRPPVSQPSARRAEAGQRR